MTWKLSLVAALLVVGCAVAGPESVYIGGEYVPQELKGTPVTDGSIYVDFPPVETEAVMEFTERDNMPHVGPQYVYGESLPNVVFDVGQN